MNLDSNKYEIHLLAIYEFNEEFAEPILDKITVVKKGSVRRNKLHFIDKMEKEYKPKERN